MPACWRCLSPTTACASSRCSTSLFYAALPAGHPLAKREVLKVSDIMAEKLLLLDEGHCLRDQALDVCGAGSRGREEVRATSLETLRQMVGNGAGSDAAAGAGGGCLRRARPGGRLKFAPSRRRLRAAPSPWCGASVHRFPRPLNSWR